jgi:hypothetical protein
MSRGGFTCPTGGAGCWWSTRPIFTRTRPRMLTRSAGGTCSSRPTIPTSRPTRSNARSLPSTARSRSETQPAHHRETRSGRCRTPSARARRAADAPRSRSPRAGRLFVWPSTSRTPSFTTSGITTTKPTGRAPTIPSRNWCIVRTRRWTRRWLRSQSAFVTATWSWCWRSASGPATAPAICWTACSSGSACSLSASGAWGPEGPAESSGG